MFFKSNLVKSLTEDHAEIRHQYEILKDPKREYVEKRLAFGYLLPLLQSHTEREERVVYRFMKNQSDDLTHYALEGKEEHRIADRIAGELQNSQLSKDNWLAKAKVLGELLDHHISEEERLVFPDLNKVLNDELDERMTMEYKKLFSPSLAENDLDDIKNIPVNPI